MFRFPEPLLYQVVHLHGDITFQHEERDKRAIVDLLTPAHKRRLGAARPWRIAGAPADYMTEMLANIVGFRIAIRRMLAKSKLSQNREPRDHDGVIEGLRAAGNPALAERMARSIGDDSEP